MLRLVHTGRRNTATPSAYQICAWAATLWLTPDVERQREALLLSCRSLPKSIFQRPSGLLNKPTRLLLLFE